MVSVELLSNCVFCVGVRGEVEWFLFCLLCVFRFLCKLLMLVGIFLEINCLCCCLVCVVVLVVRKILRGVLGNRVVFILWLFVMRLGRWWKFS